jgi:hypothetical protein
MLGRWLGKPNKGIAAIKDRIPPKKYPNHQAPTQELSSGVRLTPSGCGMRKLFYIASKLNRLINKLIAR